MVQARDNEPPRWDTTRTMVLGIGNNGQSVGKNNFYFMMGFVQDAISKLCPKMKSGHDTMRICDTNTAQIYNYTGRDSIDANITIKVGSSYFGLPGLQDVLVCGKSCSWTRAFADRWTAERCCAMDHLHCYDG